jgi:hypothetical protein
MAEKKKAKSASKASEKRETDRRVSRVRAKSRVK